jgi:hypothetical protein
MKVLINGRYAYETDLDDVEVGDEMCLPGTMSGPWHGIVTELEPSYDGRCTHVYGLSRRRAKVESEKKAMAEVRISGWRVGDEISTACWSCSELRTYRVESVNGIGRPVSLHAEACSCGAPTSGSSFGDAASFRQFMLAGQS